jgi:hypothetical protein
MKQLLLLFIIICFSLHSNAQIEEEYEEYKYSRATRKLLKKWEEADLKDYEYRDELGLGGLDIYYVKKVDGEFNEWEEIHNLGAPFNSNKDDIDFVIDKENDQGYFSSNRDVGKGGFDIYHFIQK